MDMNSSKPMTRLNRKRALIRISKELAYILTKTSHKYDERWNIVKALKGVNDALEILEDGHNSST